MSKDNTPNHAELRGHNAPPRDLHTHNGPAKRLFVPTRGKRLFEPTRGPR